MAVPSNQEKKIYYQPWYKERLQTRYLKSLGPNDTSQFLIGKNWTFLKDGLDDFRDGLPPSTSQGIFIKGQKGLAPNIQSSGDERHSVKQPAMRHRFGKHEICFSHAMPLQQQRRDHIEEIEYGLMQHPLALFPHLEEGLPPEVFEDVVDILDPEMNLGSDDDDVDDDYNACEEEEHQPTSPPLPAKSDVDKEEDRDASARPDGDGRQRNPYRWLPRKEDKDKKDRKKAVDRRSESPSQEEHIKKVTTEFCEWVEGLGGESNNIEESTITSLFASGYETKPALSVPIHVVELTNVPPELRQSATAQHNSRTQRNVPLDEERTDSAAGEKYTPSWVKFKYGAWYLDPKAWKKRNAGEPLQDPKELEDPKESDAKRKSNAMDKDLAPMHGAKAFMDFIDKKGSRRPEFLNRVAEVQAAQAWEEQAKLEAELAKQKKLQSRSAARPTS